MYIKNIKIKNFRNYTACELSFGEGLNIFSGDNAQGKTNLLEAVYLTGVGRSPRTPRDKELILSGQSRATVLVEAVSRYGSDKVEIIVDKSENKRIAINGLPITKMGELMGVVACVFFSPDELKVVKDAPGDRRRFMDIAICRMSKPYFYLLGRFNKILSQRNRLLKSGKATPDVLDVWDMQLAREGAKIVKSRHGFIKRLNQYAAKNHSYLTDGKESLEIFYEGIEGETLEQITNAYLLQLQNSRSRDIALTYTTCGLQKDDIMIMCGATDVRTYGSQGQQRTASLSLKLAETDLHFAETGENPVLLLDDVLSELDLTRQARLLERVSKMQTILTCTHIDSALVAQISNCAHYKIANGTAEKII